MVPGQRVGVPSIVIAGVDVDEHDVEAGDPVEQGVPDLLRDAVPVRHRAVTVHDDGQ